MSPCADSVSLQLFTMRSSGFCRMKHAEDASVLNRTLWRAYHLFALFMNTVHVLIRSLYTFQMRSDLSVVTQILYVTFTFVTCLAKQIVFHIKANEIDDIIARLDDPLMNQEAGARGEIMRSTTRDCARLLRVYSGSAVAWCVMWNLFPLVDRIQGRPVDFLFWIGFSIDHNAVFTAVLLFSFYVTTMGGIGQTSMDVFVVTILEQCKTQLRILRLNFETLPERAEAASKDTDELYEAALERLLSDSLLHYTKIIELCTELNDIFSMPLLVQFGIGVLILCMAAVEIVDLDLLSVQAATTSLYIACILLELFLFCYYGTRLTVEIVISERLSESIYGMEWWKMPLSIHRSLLVVMECAKRPLLPTAGQIVPLSLESYVKILKSSYSFYAVLRQTTETSLSSESVAPHLRILRCCGFCRLWGSDNGERSIVQRLHEFYRAFSFGLTMLYLLQECIYAYQARQDMDKLARVMFLLLCHITSIVKQVVFYWKAVQIDTLIGGLDEPLFNQEGADHKVLLRETAASASRFVCAYAGCAVLTCILWITFPVLYHLRAQHVEFPFWFNLDYNESNTKFYLVLAYSYYVTTLVGIANTTMDAFIGTILNQCKTQLRILRNNFENLPQNADELVKLNPEVTYEDMLTKLFVQSLAHYRRITETAKMLQDIFGTAILIQFGIGGWILCMAAYQIVSLSVLSIEFASMTLFIICILTELFLYCYYGNEVSVETERVGESIYKMEWSRTPIPFQRSLLIVMERAKRPMRPAAGLVIPLSLETFLKIIKSAYTFYAVLRQTK